MIHLASVQKLHPQLYIPVKFILSQITEQIAKIFFFTGSKSGKKYIYLKQNRRGGEVESSAFQ